MWTFPIVGAAAGMVSTVTFALVHALLISDIWFSIAPMLVAGGVCGLCVGWSFGILASPPTLGGWVRYNATFIGLLALLAVLSLIIYEPTTTLSSLLALPGPPDELFVEVMPLTVGFTIAATTLVTALFGRRWWHIGPVLTTMTVVVLLLGLNLSVFGLVSVPSSRMWVVAELILLVVALIAVYATVFAVLLWRRFQPRVRAPELSGGPIRSA